MGTVVVDRRGARLGYGGGAITVREPDGRLRSIPLRMVERLVVVGAVELETTIFTRLATQGAMVLLMPGRSAQRGQWLYGMGHGDAGRRLGQYSMAMDPKAVHAWSARFVAGRILGQARLLYRMGVTRSDRRRDLEAGRRALMRLRRELIHADTVEGLRGLEGAAAARFFAAYRGAFPASAGFRDRNRRPPKDPVNAALSLGYTLLHGDALRALGRSGLDPMLGFLHAPAHGRESLACDLVELGRARVEWWVWRLFAEQALRPEDFSREQGAVRLGKAARGVFFGSYERHAPLHRRWFRRYAEALARAAVARQRANGRGGE